MSTVEISQEERDLWRFEAADECGTPSEEDERILRLLKALEAADASIKEISDRLYKAGAISVGCSARAEKAEAQVERLQRMVDWLAVKAIRFDPSNTTWSVPDDGPWMAAYTSEEKAIEALKEAARKAVAGEGEE